MKALVLGGTGAIGRRVAAELVRAQDVAEVVVTARDGARAEHVARLLGGAKAGVAYRAVTATRAEVAAAAAGCDVLACCAGPAYLLEADAIMGSIDAGVPYVSLCDDHAATEAVLRLDGDAVAAGVTVVTGCGMSPGITNFLIALAAGELDHLEEVDVALAASSVDAPGPASARHFLHSLTQQAPVISEHRPAARSGGGGPRLVYFPEPVEWVETFRTAHPEVVTLPRTYPTLVTAEYRQGLVERAVMDAARALVALNLVRKERDVARWVRWTQPLRPLLEKLPPRGPDWTAVRVDVHGLRHERSETVSLGIADHIANLASLPLAMAAIDIGTKKTRLPGVSSPEQVFDARQFLARLSARGIRIARLEPAPVL